MTFVRVFLLLGAAAGTLCAQAFSWGARVGAPLTSALTAGNSYSEETIPITVGPTAELHLPFGLGLEADALYKRFSYNRTTGEFANTGVRSNSWEFPLLVKYRAPGVFVRPFADGGFSFRTLQGLTQFGSALLPGGDPAELKDSTSRGFVLGAGLEVHLPFLRLSPELRFTRWSSKAFESLDGGNSLSSRQNQLDLLVGITF